MAATLTQLRSTLTRTDWLVAAWMAATTVAFYHNFLVLHSTSLSYLYGFGAYGVGLVLARWDPTVRRLLVMGTVGGFVELLGDLFLVTTADTLVYPGGLPFLLRSPAYMPFTWAVLIAFMGYLAIRLRSVAGPVAASLGPAVVALVAESGFESLASRGGGWVYTSAPLAWVGHAPAFVLVAEALMFATVFYWADRRPVVGGVGMGLTIDLCYAGVYYLFVFLATL